MIFKAFIDNLIAGFHILTLHRFEEPKMIFDGDYVLYGAHRWRRSDIDALIAVGAMGITMYEEKTVIDIEQPMAMYPEM